MIPNIKPLQLSGSSAQPQIPVDQSSSAGGWYVIGKVCPHSGHLRAFNCQMKPSANTKIIVYIANNKGTLAS